MPQLKNLFAANRQGNIFVLFTCFLFLPSLVLAIGQEQYVETFYHKNNFKLAERNVVAPIYVDSKDYPGVVRAISDLQEDIHRVTDSSPAIFHERNELTAEVILVGTLGKSELIDRLVRDHVVDVTQIAGKWESFLVQVVDKPLPGITKALLIVGSDKRGTIFGIYDLSEQIGVSPWYWWADVPIAHSNALFITPGKHIQGPPAVKYRGIFLNDEAPSLTGWVKEKFGNYNHEFYSKVFELLLRLKADYLWPAMWNNAFNEDDSQNTKLADEYGIVMGTSHHEPMLRAQREWKRHGKGPWDYTQNAPTLQEFWRQGIERNKSYESIITLGMRGDGDLPMSESANISLLEKIVSDQRKIIEEEIHVPISQIPQDWALYKEVQEYYERGMRVPDDVTLLWCDDNWGNIRRLPTPDERHRGGGAGIYYHFDYVGDPRSYKWLNTNPLPKVWEQMNLAYHYGADRIWIANVGDLKPMELPITFFLSLAWNPNRWGKEHIEEFTRLWAQQQFGSAHAAEIADILSKYAKYNGRRKPELLEPDTFGQIDYREADTVFADWNSLAEKADEIYKQLPENQRDSFFELVLYPTKASAIVSKLYITVGKARLYASQHRASAIDLVAQAHFLFQEDADLSAYYNHDLAHGKWNHMMDQTHIGYTSWNEPEKNVMPAVSEIDVPQVAQMGVAIEGSSSAWPGSIGEPVLPTIDFFNQGSQHIDIFNRGRDPFAFTAQTNDPWIILSELQGTIEKEKTLLVSIDWAKAARGLTHGSITIRGAQNELVTVKVDVSYPNEPKRNSLRGFVESNGNVSMESVHYTRKIDSGSARWESIDDFGRTSSAMTIFPVTAQSVIPPENSPHLEYKMFLFDPGRFEVEAILAPTLNFVPGRGLRYAISFDNQEPQVIDALANNSQKDWEIAVKDGVRKIRSIHSLERPGYHVLKFWMVDPGVVLEKLVVDLGGVKPSYLGPPESYHVIESVVSPQPTE
jgi:Glycosyl hydrolase family 115/Gylcosyl hydrolase family 115 C-terminal domain